MRKASCNYHNHTTEDITHEGDNFFYDYADKVNRLNDAEDEIERQKIMLERQKIMLDAFTDVAVENRLRIDALERVVKRLAAKVEVDSEEIKKELIAEMKEHAKAIPPEVTAMLQSQGVTAPLQPQDSK